ncbi:hypothetical protein FHS13_002651 [Nocardiopsis algeriensis]|uniref:Uncharacterized protein n=1 Tax=Nocardiopsis algeriensis TaxID=1478215 RepID=A0A841IR44_9ACTN|nr:hypothetical protein [Nocardiopsis algeriensis]
MDRRRGRRHRAGGQPAPAAAHRPALPASAAGPAGGACGVPGGPAGRARPGRRQQRRSVLGRGRLFGCGGLGAGRDGRGRQDRSGPGRGCDRPPQGVVLRRAVREPARLHTRRGSVDGGGGAGRAAAPDGRGRRGDSARGRGAGRLLPIRTGGAVPGRRTQPAGAGGGRQRPLGRPGTAPAAGYGRAPAGGHHPRRPARAGRRPPPGPGRAGPRRLPRAAVLHPHGGRPPGRARARCGGAGQVGRTVRAPAAGVGDHRGPARPQASPVPGQALRPVGEGRLPGRQDQGRRSRGGADPGAAGSLRHLSGPAHPRGGTGVSAGGCRPGPDHLHRRSRRTHRSGHRRGQRAFGGAGGRAPAHPARSGPMGRPRPAHRPRHHPPRPTPGPQPGSGMAAGPLHRYHQSCRRPCAGPSRRAGSQGVPRPAGRAGMAGRRTRHPGCRCPCRTRPRTHRGSHCPATAPGLLPGPQTALRGLGEGLRLRSGSSPRRRRPLQ